MFSTKKRLTAFLSALLLVCSLLTVNVSAATAKESTTNRSLKVTAACSMPSITINVVVPSSTKSYINPSQTTVKLGATTMDTQIITETAYIENRSAIPISVSASVTGAVKSGSAMKFTTESTKDSSSTEKLAFVFFQMKATADPDPYKVEWDKTYDPDKDILVTTATNSKTDFVKLDKYDADTDDGTAKRYGSFLLSGDCTEMPTTAWSTKDGFTTQIAFTFKALAYDTEID
jgi:hypothetical protein